MIYIHLHLLAAALKVSTFFSNMWTVCCKHCQPFVANTANALLQGRNEGAQGGHNSPGAESLRGTLKCSNSVTVLSSIHYIYFGNIPGSNMGAPNLLLAPGAIYAPALL